MSAVTGASDEKWEIESAAESVIRAEEIKADKKMWPKVQKELKRKAAAARRAALATSVGKKLKDTFPST